MAQQSIVNYQVSFPDSKAHYVNVEMNIDAGKAENINLKMPVWTPGSYLVREFARHVEGFEASQNGKNLSWKKTDKNTWSVKNSSSGKITINYQVYAFELTVRTSFVDDEHAYLNGASVFMFAEEMDNNPIEISVLPKDNWKKISTGLPSVSQNRFSAKNYDELADSPFEIGNQEIINFSAAGIPHEIAMFGSGKYNKEKIVADMTKIINEEAAIFGKHPCEKYVFIIHNLSTGGGGLEHLNSTTLQVSRDAYSNESSYLSFLSLVAHEYFHLWNVKRLRPEALGPFNYSVENYTQMLWVSEGFTAYYDDLITRRTGFYSPGKYLDLVSSTINTIENAAGNKVQSASESSFDAWIKYYKRNENSTNSTVSYYDKGALIALVIDMEIMNQSKGSKNLDDLMKYMYDEYYTKLNRGFTDEEFQKGVEKLTGKSMDLFFRNQIYGTQAFDYNTIFTSAGLKLVNTNANKNEPFLGILNTQVGGKIMITSVFRNGSAQLAGISPNDEIIASDNYRVDDIAKIVVGKKVGDVCKLIINRDGKILTIDVPLLKSTIVKYTLEQMDKPTELQTKVYKKWLKI